MGKISGYELARRVLLPPQGGVEALLRLSGNDESCWLECKAGVALLPEDVRSGSLSLLSLRILVFYMQLFFLGGIFYER